MKNKANGFTLVEIAIVLVIIGLLMAGSLSLFSGQRTNIKIKESNLKLSQIKSSLLSFAITNGYLPCPDSPSNRDGAEDREGDGTCSLTAGAVPYSDIGLTGADIRDSYGNLIRYAVNRNTIDTGDICDSGKSSSYFCDQSPPQFTLQTPPTKSTISVGDYTICEGQPSCTPPNNTYIDQASVVLVAFNTFAGNMYTSTSKSDPTANGNCSNLSPKESENCDIDEVYVHDIFSGVEGNFFDDNVMTITGYEIKQKLLQSGVDLATNLAGGGGNSGSGTMPPPSSFSFTIPPLTNPDQELNGDYNHQNQLSTSNNDDSILVHGNINHTLNLQNGDNQLQVEGDTNRKVEGGNDDDTIRIEGNINDKVQLKDGNNILETSGDTNGKITGGAGSDIVRVAGNLNESVNLKGGNDRLEVFGDVNGSIDMGSGDDFVALHQTVNNTVSLESGDDEIWVLGNFNQLINGGSGQDTIHLPYTSSDWSNLAPWKKALIQGFETYVCTDGSCS